MLLNNYCSPVMSWLMNKIYLVILMVSFSSCLPHINYLGNSYPATKTPDFYVDEKSIGKPYKVIGKDPNRFGLSTLKTLQKKAIEKAKTKGADAVLVQDYFPIANIGASYHSDLTGKGVSEKSTLSAGDNADVQFIILFLKYTDQ